MNHTFLVRGDTRKVGAVENGALQRPRFEQGLFRPLARGIVGADKQVADDSALAVAQCRDGHDCGETAPVLADVGQLVNILDPARGLENQGFEPRCNRGFQLLAQRFGTGDHFLRIGYLGRSDLVHHFSGLVAQHPLRSDIEDLDHAFFVRGDTRKVGAVENGVLQGPGF